METTGDAPGVCFHTPTTGEYSVILDHVGGCGREDDSTPRTCLEKPELFNGDPLARDRQAITARNAQRQSRLFDPALSGK